MKTNESLIKYLKTMKTNEVIQLLNENGMYHMFADEFPQRSYVDKNLKIINKLCSRSKRVLLDEIVCVFEENDIKYTVFKGLILSYLLYQDFDIRQFGDIDIYIHNEKVDKAIDLLEGLGFTVIEGKHDEAHHSVLVKDSYIVELHRKIFNPKCEIAEMYFGEHLDYVKKYPTFDITATFLHLLYHFYSDTIFTTDLYSLYVAELYPQRFFLREYEIALFAEKYSKNINWVEIVRNIESTKLRITFRYMFEDIIRKFPESFPVDFLEVVFSKNYIEQKEEREVKLVLGNKYSYERAYMEKELSMYIQKNWNPFNDSLNINLGDKIIISSRESLEKQSTNGNGYCEFEISKKPDGIQFIFKVNDKDFVSADNSFPDVHRSDGVQLFLCGIENGNYSYRNIFMFPTIKFGIPKVAPYDVRQKIIYKSDDINANLEMHDDKYKMTILFTNEFLYRNHMNNFILMNVVICDCNPITQKRERTLNLIKQSSEWYNPILFFKIDCYEEFDNSK